MKKTIKKLLIIALFVGCGSAYAQFSIPVSKPDLNKECYAIKTDGTKVKGTWQAAAISGGYMTSTTVKDASGTKHKFKAADLKEFAFKPGKASAFEALTGEASGNMRFSKKDMQKIMDREWIHYVTGSKKGKAKGKPRLLQSLNAGWEVPIQVFVDPKAKTGMGVSVGSMSVAGGRSKSYIVEKNGEPMMVEKGKYKKQVKTLFGDCPEFKKDFPEPDWKDFPTHVFTYNQLMKKK